MKDKKQKSLIDPNKLKQHPKQIIKETKISSIEKKKGPIPATPEHWKKCGVKMNPESIAKIKLLKLTEGLANRDIIVENALLDYFKKFKSLNK